MIHRGHRVSLGVVCCLLVVHSRANDGFHAERTLRGPQDTESQMRTLVSTWTVASHMLEGRRISHHPGGVKVAFLIPQRNLFAVDFCRRPRDNGAMTRITHLQVDDVRFPTSIGRHGSDAMNRDPDYSAAYLTLHTEGQHQGNGLVFTLGRGTELCCQAVLALQSLVVGRQLEEIWDDFAGYWRELTNESQLRWLGPEKGTVHMAAGALLNAIWDLSAREAGLPLWQFVSRLTPEQIVGTIDFRYLTDALTADEALEILEHQAPQRETRIAELLADGYPAYTTSAGWLGYSDQQIRQRCRDAMAAGWRAFKVKVGADLAQDRHRLRLVREEIGPASESTLMADANQVWDVPEAIRWLGQLGSFDLQWIEEPTSPDDVLGHAAIARAIAPLGVATGEMGQNRVLFKQLMQAGAISYCQIDSCRLAGVNEVLAVLLLAAKFGVPVCPHGGGVGLCEHIQHLAAIDYICVSGSLDNRWAEYVDHLHEHFVDPCRVDAGRYRMPITPGYSVRMRRASVEQFGKPLQ